MVAVATSADGQLYTYTSTSYQSYATTIPDDRDSSGLSNSEEPARSPVGVIGGVVGVTLLAALLGLTFT